MDKGLSLFRQPGVFLGDGGVHGILDGIQHLHAALVAVEQGRGEGTRSVEQLLKEKHLAIDVRGPGFLGQAADAAAEEQPETVEPETNEATAREPEVRAPIDELPEQKAPAATDAPLTCTISISCATILEHLDELDPEKVELVPEDGWILAPVTVEFTAGQNVFDVLLATVKANAIHMEYQNTPMYETAYIEGIGNLYEFDVGSESGWMYAVNGWYPNYGCSRYVLQDGDTVEWVYTCDLGQDVGGGFTG